MGNAQGGPGGPPGGKKDDKKDGEKKKWKSKGGPSRVGRKKRKKGPAPIARLPKIYPSAKCKLRLSKLTRVKDFLLLEEEFMKNQELLKPKKEKDQKELAAVEDVRGTPLSVGNLEGTFPSLFILFPPFPLFNFFNNGLPLSSNFLCVFRMGTSDTFFCFLSARSFTQK